MFRRHIVKWQLAVAALGVCAVVALLATVTFSVSTTIVPDTGGTYVEAVVGRPRWINPILSSANEPDQDLSALVFSGLMRIGIQGQPEADLAESWTIEDEGRSYTFVLRKDLLWQDGQPVTADDVVYTVRALQDPDFQGQREYAELWQGVTVEKLNATTVRFRLKDIYAPFLEYATQGLLPAHILGQVSAKNLPGHAFNANPVGTGPYRVVSASLNEVVLEANQYYAAGQPYIKQVKMVYFDNIESATAALRREQVQGLAGVTADVLSQVAGDKTELVSAPELARLSVLLFNTKDPLFAEPAVRQAIAYAIDVPSLIEKVLSGQGVRSYGPIIPNSWAYNQEMKKYEHNLKEAAALLDAQGWTLSDGGTVRKKAGQAFQFVLLTNDSPLRIATAQELARQLERVGIKVDVQTTGWTGYVRDFLAPRKFQAAVMELLSPNADPDCYQFWHSSQIKDGLNFSSWVNRKADDLLEQGRRLSSLEERRLAYAEFQTIFASDLPAVPLYYPMFNFAVSKDIKGASVGMLLRPADRYRDIASWYVRTKRVVGQG